MADLFRAAESGNVRALKRHLRAGKDCNTQTRSTKATPLIWGARKQQKKSKAEDNENGLDGLDAEAAALAAMEQEAEAASNAD